MVVEQLADPRGGIIGRTRQVAIAVRQERPAGAANLIIGKVELITQEIDEDHAAAKGDRVEGRRARTRG